MTTEPIEKSIIVPLRPKAAFDLFTKDLEKWWPLDSHSVAAGKGDLPLSVSVEPFEGGRIIETLPDGSTAPWGKVTTWQPGAAFGVQWHVGRPTEEATDILVVFTPTDIGTRVDLTHSGFDRLGTAATAMLGEYRQGWDYVFCGRFAAHCASRVFA